MGRLEAAIQSRWGTTGGNPSGSKRNAKFGGRCATHSLDIDRRRGGGSSAEEVHWIDTWDSMVRECQEEVVQIHFDALRDTLDRYLKRHNFCSECASNVNEAYSHLVGEYDDSDEDEVSCSSDEDNEDTPPALVQPRPPSSTESIDSSLQSSRPASPDDPSPASPGSFKEEVKERFMQAVERVKRRPRSRQVYKGITACPENRHIHVQCCPIYVSKMITLADPHLSGIKVERCARTKAQAQKEVLICIGICLHDRLQRIQRRLREGQQSCDLLFLMALKSFKKSFEMACFESKQGMTDLEKFCLELDEEDRRKKEQAKKKRG